MVEKQNERSARKLASPNLYMLLGIGGQPSLGEKKPGKPQLQFALLKEIKCI
jgi:hypothetical protein